MLHLFSSFCCIFYVNKTCLTVRVTHVYTSIIIFFYIRQIDLPCLITCFQYVRLKPFVHVAAFLRLVCMFTLNTTLYVEVMTNNCHSPFHKVLPV